MEKPCMDALAYPLYDTKVGVVLSRVEHLVAIKLEEGIRLAPANQDSRPGQRVEVLVRRGLDRALAIRSAMHAPPANQTRCESAELESR